MVGKYISTEYLSNASTGKYFEHILLSDFVLFFKVHCQNINMYVLALND
jgi:hypothetical protein